MRYEPPRSLRTTRGGSLKTLGIDLGPRGTNPTGIPLTEFSREMQRQLTNWFGTARRPGPLGSAGVVRFDRDYWAKTIAANPALIRQLADLATKYSDLRNVNLAASGLRSIADQLEQAVRSDPGKYAAVTPEQIELAAAIIYAESHPDETQ